MMKKKKEIGKTKGDGGMPNIVCSDNDSTRTLTFSLEIEPYFRFLEKSYLGHVNLNQYLMLTFGVTSANFEAS